MKVLLDANVLYPTVLRGVLLGVARKGLFVPLWSPRILEEWARAVARNHPEQAGQVRVEIAQLELAWPRASIDPRPRDLNRLVLPDPADVHVLAAAIAGSANMILTQNARDFPRHTLTEEGLSRQDADAFLRAMWAEAPGEVAEVVEAERGLAETVIGEPVSTRTLLKRARLPRLAKAVG